LLDRGVEESTVVESRVLDCGAADFDEAENAVSDLAVAELHVAEGAVLDDYRRHVRHGEWDHEVVMLCSGEMF
jgi:hypothetical protein